MSITLDGLEFELSDFVGTDGLGHATVQPATTGASGESYPAEALFPERIFRAALNQLGQGLYSTSTSSVAIGTGSKAFTLATSVQITDGAFVLVTDQANDANYMYGQVTSVAGLVYTVNVTDTGGSGTIAAWNFQVSGVRGATGAAGASYTNEEAQDAVGSILTDTATIDFTYDDGANTITADVKDASLERGKFTDTARQIDSSALIPGALTVRDYIVGYYNETVTLSGGDMQAGAGTGTVELYLSSNTTSASGTIITGGSFSVSTTVDENTFTAANTVTAGTPRWVIAKCTAGTGLENVAINVTERR